MSLLDTLPHLCFSARRKQGNSPIGGGVDTYKLLVPGGTVLAGTITNQVFPADNLLAAYTWLMFLGNVTSALQGVQAQVRSSGSGAITLFSPLAVAPAVGDKYVPLQACWRQQASVNEQKLWEQRSIIVTNKFYFSTKPELDEGCVIDCLLAGDPFAARFDVISRAIPDSTAGFNLMYRVMVREFGRANWQDLTW